MGLPFLLAVLFALAAVVLGLFGLLDQPKATVIAACIVPTLGFLGFRYQKFLDRGATALEAKRDAYRNYIQAANEYLQEAVRSGSAPLWELSKQADLLFLIASDDVAKCAQSHLMAAKYFCRTSVDDDFQLDMRLGFENVQSDLIALMRRDLQSDTSFVPKPISELDARLS